MRRRKQVVRRMDGQALTEFLASEGQLLLALVQFIEDAELPVDECIGSQRRRVHPFDR